MSFNNNVVALLSSIASTDDLSLTFNTPISPFNVPPAIGGTLTLSDNLNNPSVIEVITYTGLTDNLNGTHTITGVARAQESTNAAPWSVGHVLYQAVTQVATNKWDDATDRYLTRETAIDAILASGGEGPLDSPADFYLASTL